MGFKTPAKDERYSNAIVVDNSITMRWLFKDGSAADQKYAKNVLEAIQSHHLTVLAPPIWVYEAAFVTRHYINQQAINLGDANQQLDALFELTNIIRSQDTPNDLLGASQILNLSAYDAAYLLLSQQQRCPLATLDKKMRRACKKLDISPFNA